MYTLQGTAFIAGKRSPANQTTFSAINPKDRSTLPTAYSETTPAEISEACDAARKAFDVFSLTDPLKRAQLLREIAREIESLGDQLIERYTAESALPAPRAISERGRTCAQLRMFADYIEEGSWVEARIDRALPDRKPIPRTDLRSMLRPIGPIAVFGPANFPLAYTVAGGDTASALAAGCPVIVKAHPSHPGTSELVGSAIARAAETCDLPAGIFSLIFGTGAAAGTKLVANLAIKGVGFTGSKSAGQALLKVISQRYEPIPFFGELSSTNPVFILPGAMSERAEKISEDFHGSLTLGVGQFCTNPGIVVFIRSAASEKFQDALLERIKNTAPGTMLNEGITRNYTTVLSKIDAARSATPLTVDRMIETQVLPALFRTSAQQFIKNPELHEELFGPASILVACENEAELLSVAQSFEGQLTASFHYSENELSRPAFQEVLNVMSGRVGRVIFNQFPTGVEVCPAMVHGGPWPASSDSRFTSVGTPAIRRWARPVCWQAAPKEVLPPALQDENPLRIARLVNGQLEMAARGVA